ncbi:MAG: hypothetical protein WAU69_06770 [Solirubrobacteraceae bacterium]
MRTKMLAAALLAVFILSINASEAFAVEFKAATYPVKLITSLKAGEVTSLGVGTAKVECKSFKYSPPPGEPELLPGATSTVVGVPEYSECTAFGTAVNISALKELIFLLSWKEIGGKWVPTFKLVGNKGAKGGFLSIKVPLTGCEITVGEQEIDVGTEEKNISEGKIEAIFKLAKISYKSNVKGVGCPKEGEEATFAQKLIAEGKTEAGASDAIRFE